MRQPFYEAGLFSGRFADHRAGFVIVTSRQTRQGEANEDAQAMVHHAQTISSREPTAIPSRGRTWSFVALTSRR